MKVMKIEKKRKHLNALKKPTHTHTHIYVGVNMSKEG
jgi:hypothetical protein